MGWFWKSKSKSKSTEPQPEQLEQFEQIEPLEEFEAEVVPTLEETLQAEIDRLQVVNAEVTRQQTEWQASAETAMQERDALRAETAETLSSERQQSADKIAELHRKKEEMESNFAQVQQKLSLLDEANVSMAEMIRQGEANVQQRDQRLAEMESQHATNSTRMLAQIADLTQQMTNLSQQLTTAREDASAKLMAAEQRISADSVQAAERIANLERQLAESETRSANRAEQRSALLRNMIEIHRLSTTSSKSDIPSDSLKLINPGWSEQAVNPVPSAEPDSASSNAFYSRSGTWSESSESESA